MLARMDVTCIMAFVELHSDFLSEGQTVKQFLKQTGLPLVSQRPNKAKPDSQSVNTNDPDYLDCLTVDRPGRGTPGQQVGEMQGRRSD